MEKRSNMMDDRVEQRKMLGAHEMVPLEEDRALLDMIRHIEKAGEKITETIEETDLDTIEFLKLTDQLSILGRSMARIRESMNPKFGPGGYGCGLTIV